MTKMKKLISLLVVVAMLFTFVAVVAACATHECADPCPTCGLCTTDCGEKACKDKCKGHGTGGENHTCQSVCATCQKCTNLACQETACASKCEGHSTSKYGTEEAPLSVAQTLALADEELPTAGNVTAEIVYTRGKVKSIGPTKSSTYLSEVYITDVNDSSKEIMIYSLNTNSGVAVPVQNDIISIHGYIKNYDGTIEFASNKVDGSDVYVYTYANVRGTSTITLVNDGNATVTGLSATATNGSEVSFTVTAPADKDIGQVLLGDKPLTKGDDDHYKFTVAGNATVTVEVVDQGTHVAQLVYSLVTNTTKGSNNAYAGNCDVTIEGITWNIEGNADQLPWRFGGKSITNQDRKLTSKTALQHNVTKIVVNFGSATATVNSITLNVFSSDPTAEGFSDAPVFTKTLTFTANGKVEVEKEDSTDWTGFFYQLVFNVTCGGSNQYVSITTMDFYA